MTQIRHTPGPWVLVEPHTEEDGSVYPPHITGGARELQICELGLPQFWKNDAIMEAAGDTRSKRANAALICAAPNLLDLVENVGGQSDWFEKSADVNALRAALREYRTQAQEILSALAKAATP